VRILVTGASGFIGAHVARLLAERGDAVRALCRSAPPPAAGPAEWTPGDVTDARAVARAVEGCDAVVHTAALYSYARADAAPMQAINVDGTRHVLDAAARAGLRVVVTSTAATCGPVAGRAADERDAPAEWELRVPYKRTKVAAERLALARAAAGADVIVVNPTTTVGPGDRRPTPSGQMLRDAAAGRMRGYIPGAAINVVAVEDVAAGHVLALERGRSGERYLLGGEDLALREALAIAARAAGRGAPRWPVPWRVALGAAHLARAGARVRGREPHLLVLDEVRLARVPMRFSSAKAAAELGYAPRPAREALTAAVSWLRDGAA
jgi:dihydroflavonol-4-reductase